MIVNRALVREVLQTSVAVTFVILSIFIVVRSLGFLQQAVRGDVLVRVHDVHHTGRAPEEYRARIDGILAGRHFPGLIRHGDFVALVAVPV